MYYGGSPDGSDSSEFLCVEDGPSLLLLGDQVPSLSAGTKSPPSLRLRSVTDLNMTAPVRFRLAGSPTDRDGSRPDPTWSYFYVSAGAEDVTTEVLIGYVPRIRFVGASL